MTPSSEVREVGDIPKAKSTSVLHAGVSFADEVPVVESEKKRHHARKGTAPLPLRSPGVKHHTKEPNDEWFHRAGLAIAGETRDSKGQGWLVRRESSTSLVGESDPFDQHHAHDDRRMALLSGEHLGDADFPSFFSQRNSRAGSRIPSRVGSRVPSARQSRRGSRVGSRVDLMTGLGFKNQSGRQSLDISELEERFIEPDFIEADEESDGDEEEVARLARERGFGLGGWMDSLLGWSLFSVDEDREGSDDDDDELENNTSLRLDNITAEQLKLRREVEAKRRKLERETIIAASALNRREGDASESSRPSTADKLPPANEEGGGWQDAAWLLSVASKALF